MKYLLSLHKIPKVDQLAFVLVLSKLSEPLDSFQVFITQLIVSMCQSRQSILSVLVPNTVLMSSAPSRLVFELFYGRSGVITDLDPPGYGRHDLKRRRQDRN